MWTKRKSRLLQNTGGEFSGYYDQYPQNQAGSVLEHYRNLMQQPQYNADRRRKRARPRSHYSHYSGNLSHLNFSNENVIARGRFLNSSRGMGPGRDMMSQSVNNRLPQKSQPIVHQQLQGNTQTRVSTVDMPTVDNREPYHHQSQDNRIDNRLERDHFEDKIPYSSYVCPKCKHVYTVKYSQNKRVGKVPLILQCSHTMCQECIYQGLSNNKVSCPICETDSSLTQEQTPVCQSDLQNVFLPNFFVMGVMSYHKASSSHLKNLENMTFVASGHVKKHKITSLDPSDRCCFATCLKEATMFCPSCEGIYCSDCCTAVHKSAKNLMSHEPLLRQKKKFTFMLENCHTHPTMQVDFFCKTCDLAACCYCVLESHTEHDRVTLYHLNEAEMEEFKKRKKIAEKVLKEVLTTQKKATQLANFDTSSVKKEICHYFMDCHAKLETLEKKLCDQLDGFKENNRDLENIQSSLTAAAEQLKQLVAFKEDNIGDMKVNLRGALDKLKKVQNIPRFLLNEHGEVDPIKFNTSNTAIDSLEDDLSLTIHSSEYRLVTENELPEGYLIDVDETDTEIEETLSTLMNTSNQYMEANSSISKSLDLSSTRPTKHVEREEPVIKKLGNDMKRVDVQHINSMESFFVQFKGSQTKLMQLNKDIENYVKMGGAPITTTPEINDLYLALYSNETNGKVKQTWYRARLMEITNGSKGRTYEMFFIDYGKTQLVAENRIREISFALAQNPPFAIECMLHNPMGVNWNSQAHLSLAKLLNGKDVYMMEKAYNQGVYEVDLMVASSDGGVTSVMDILLHAHNSVDHLDDISLDGSTSTKKDTFYPTLKVFPNSKKFASNARDRVTIAAVMDPHNIFVHMVKYQKEFKQLTQGLKKAYKNSKTQGCIPVEGTYVIVEYKDPIRSNWHRAYVKYVDLNSDKVHVLLVDWGLNVVVPINNVRTLQESHTKLETQAVPVKLAHVAPFNKRNIWSPQAANFLQTFVKSQEVLEMIVQDTTSEVEVALFDITGNVDLCLNAMLVEHNLADSVGTISSKLEWPRFSIKNPEFSEEDGFMSTLLKKVDEDEANDDSEPEDSRDIKKRQIDVVKVDSPDSIWVKFLEFKNRESEMFRDLQVHYSQQQDIKSTWKVGEQCVTEFENEFLRGRISEKTSDGYKVYLLDKVKEIISPIDKIYVYDKYFAKYPQAVIKCHLANIRPAGDTGNWSRSSIEALQQIISKHHRLFANKAQEADPESCKRSLPLDMWYGLVIQGGPLDPDRMKYVCINNSLVKLGFAYKVAKPVATTSSVPVVQTPVRKVATGDDLLKSLVNEVDIKEQPEDKKTSVGRLKLKKKQKEEIVQAKKQNAEESISFSDQPSGSDGKLGTCLKASEDVNESATEETKLPCFYADSDYSWGRSSFRGADYEFKVEWIGQRFSSKLFVFKVDNLTLSDFFKGISFVFGENGSFSLVCTSIVALSSGDTIIAVNVRVFLVTGFLVIMPHHTLAEHEKTFVMAKLQEGWSLQRVAKEHTEAEPIGKTESSDQKLGKNNANIEKQSDDQIENWNTLVEMELRQLQLSDKNVADEPGDNTTASNDSPYHKREMVVDDWLSPFRLTKSEFQARVTCVETGGYLYLHEEKLDDVYYKMERNIKEYFDTNPPEVNAHQWEPGQLCTIKYIDGNWYRGKILKVLAPNKISVFMVDFGSDHELSPDVLFREVLYTDIGLFATKVKLDKVYAKSGSWLTSDYDHFQSIVTDWCRIVVKGPINVELPLVEVYNENGVFVNQKLLELCPNLSRSSTFPVPVVDDIEDDAVIESEELYIEEIPLASLNEELDVQSLDETTSQIAPIDWKYKIKQLPEELLQGKKVLMEVGGIMNFNRVALRLPEKDISEEMYDLIIRLQDIVEYLPMLEEFKIGMPCLVPYSEDDIWYRARIIGVNAVDSGFVDVIFVDYGNLETVSTKTVRTIRRDHMTLPQQCWEVNLNITSEEVKLAMQAIKSLYEKKKYAKLVRVNPLSVDLYEETGLLCYETEISSGLLKPLYTDES